MKIDPSRTVGARVPEDTLVSICKCGRAAYSTETTHSTLEREKRHHSR